MTWQRTALGVGTAFLLASRPIIQPNTEYRCIEQPSAKLENASLAPENDGTTLGELYGGKNNLGTQSKLVWFIGEEALVDSHGVPIPIDPNMFTALPIVYFDRRRLTDKALVEEVYGGENDELLDNPWAMAREG